MIQLVLEQLKKIDNPNVEKLLNIFSNKLPKVNSNYYNDTIFGSQENFDKTKPNFNVKIPGITNLKIWESPLTYLRGGNVGQVFFAGKNQGVAFGFVLVHYITKQPLLIVNVDKDNTQSKYLSTRYDDQTKTYVESINENCDCTNTNELFDFVILQLNKDIDKFIQK